MRNEVNSLPIIRPGNMSRPLPTQSKRLQATGLVSDPQIAEYRRIRQALIKSYDARRLHLYRDASGFEFRANYWQSQNIALSYISGMPFELEFPTANFLDRLLSEVAPISGLMESKGK